MRSLLAASCLVAACACAPHYEQSLEIVEALELTDGCSISDVPRERGLFDISTLEPSEYWLPFRFAFEASVDGEPLATEFLILRSFVFFASDDVELQLVTTPLDPFGARVSAGNTAGLAPGALTDTGFARVVIPEDATSLAREPAIAAALTSPEDRVRVDVHVAIEGNVSAYVSPSGAPPARSSFFTYALDLCAGCLVPRCPEGEVLQGACIQGMDVASTCEAPP